MAKGGSILEAVVSLSGQVSPSLTKVVGEVLTNMDKLHGAGEKVGKVFDGVPRTVMKAAAGIGKTVGKITLAVGKLSAQAALSAGKYLAELGDDWNQTMNQLSASTGATGAKLDALGDSVKNVYADNFGENFSEVADALSDVKKVTDLTGSALEQATEYGFLLRDTFEYEVSESARAAASLMKNFHISAEKAYGLIAIGAQNGADKNGDLLDTLNEYSGQFSALGLSADEFVGSLISGADAGLFSIDKVGDAVKEFNIRSKDGSDSSRQAFESLGMNADKLFAAFAAGGETANAAFFDVVEALDSMEDPLLKNNTAVALFGTQYEDLEAGLLPVLSSVEDAAYDGATALAQINEVKYKDLGSAFEQIKRTAETSLLPIASLIANSLTALMPMISSALDSIIPVITNTLNTCMPFVDEFLTGIGTVLETVLPMVADLAAELLPVLSELISALLPPILDLIKKLLPPLVQIVQALLPPISSILSAILPMLVSVIDMILPVLVGLIDAMLPVITPLLDLLLQVVNDVVMAILPPLLSMVESIIPVAVSLISSLTPILEPILGLLAPIASVLAEIVGWVGKIVSGGLGKAVSWIFGLFGGSEAKTPEVPAYSGGGFTSGLSIAGEDPLYPTEAVISFNPAYREQNLSYWARAGRMLGASEESMPLSGGSETSVTYDLGAITFSPQLYIDGDVDEDAIIRKLRDLEPEFVDFVIDALRRRQEGAYVNAEAWEY